MQPPVARIRGTKPTDAVRSIVFADSPYAVQAIDDVLMVDATDGAVVVTIPSVAMLRKAYLNRRLTIKKVDASANAVTVTAFLGELIDGSATLALSTQYAVVTVTNDLGSDVWWTVTVAGGSAGVGTVTHTGALTANAIILGNGAADIKAAASLGTTSTVLHGNAAGAPSFGQVALGSEVSGDLPFANFVQATAASKLVGRGSASGAGDFQEITLGSNLSMSGTTLNATDTDTGITQLTGDVTAGPGSGSQAATIAANAVTFSKMQDIATQTLIGRDTAGTSDPESVTISQALDWLGA